MCDELDPMDYLELLGLPEVGDGPAVKKIREIFASISDEELPVEQEDEEDA